jgi:dihydrofolate reductase
MGRIVVTEFISIDGVIEDPGGSEGFKHGGWSMETSSGEDGMVFKFEEAKNSAALLLGKVTYEEFAQAWPPQKHEFADLLNAMPKYVVSTTLRDPQWNNTTVLAGDAPTEVARLRQAVDGDIVVHGSATLVQTLIEHDLVDELRLMVSPVVLGAGKRLFGHTSDKRTLRLAEARAVGDGVTILIFQKR